MGLDIGEGRARRGGDQARGRVDRVDRGESAQAEHDRAGGGSGRYRPADQAGVAALRYDGPAVGGADAQDGGYLTGRGGAGHGGGAAGEGTGPVGFVTGGEIAVDQDVVGAERRHEIRDQPVLPALVFASVVLALPDCSTHGFRPPRTIAYSRYAAISNIKLCHNVHAADERTSAIDPRSLGAWCRARSSDHRVVPAARGRGDEFGLPRA